MTITSPVALFAASKAPALAAVGWFHHNTASIKISTIHAADAIFGIPSIFVFNKSISGFDI